MKRRTNPSRRTGNRKPRPRLAFDAQQWFAEIDKELATETHPIMRQILWNARAELQLFTWRFPSLRGALVPKEQLEMIATLLGELVDIGIAPPGYPRIECDRTKLTFRLVLVDDLLPQEGGLN